MVRYEELGQDIIQQIQSSGITWDEHKQVYFTQLYKEFYLKEVESKSEDHIIEFCNLVMHPQNLLEYGVGKEWGDSELNKYVYRLNKIN